MANEQQPVQPSQPEQFNARGRGTGENPFPIARFDEFLSQLKNEYGEPLTPEQVTGAQIGLNTLGKLLQYLENPTGTSSQEAPGARTPDSEPQANQ